jgi:hypothetical protein
VRLLMQPAQLGGIPFAVSANMSLICDLSEVLIDSLLLSWVKVEDVGRLDSAMCNKFQRAVFLSLINRDKFVLDHSSVRQDRGEPVDSRVDQFISWILARHIAVAELSVSTSLVNDTDKRLKYLQHHGKHIKRVTLGDGAGVPRKCKSAIEDLCGCCPNVTLFESSIPLPAATYTAIANWKKLTHLTLEDYTVGDEFLSIGEYCQSLLELNMWGRRIPQLQKFFKVCSPNLQSIGMQTSLEPEDYVSIASRCHMLRKLEGPTDLMDDTALIALGSGCPLFSALDLEYNRLVTDAGLVAFSRNGALTDLWLDSCDRLTDQGFRAVAQCSPLLQHVGFNNCTVTDITLIALGRHCHDLRKLTISDASVTGEGLAAIGAGCPLLEEVNAWDCDGIGPAIAAIARGCPRLRVLAASEADVPAAAVLALAECCPLLEEVGVSGEEIGDEEISALVSGCPVLRRLQITGTFVTLEGLRAIREHCKMLKEIELDAELFPGGEPVYEFFPHEVDVEYN